MRALELRKSDALFIITRIPVRKTRDTFHKNAAIELYSEKRHSIRMKFIENKNYYILKVFLLWMLTKLFIDDLHSTNILIGANQLIMPQEIFSDWISTRNCVVIMHANF